MAFGPTNRVQFRGVLVSRRTKRALVWAEKASGFKFRMAQGSWSHFKLSAGTHSGSGVVDIGMAGVPWRQRVRIIRALKDAGFAVWFRKPPAFSPHLHACLFNEPGMAEGARNQLRSFDARRDGLAGNGSDNTYRPRRKVKFGFWRNIPVPR